jgi:hypothetical protein
MNGWHYIYAATSAAGNNRLSAKDVVVGLIAAYFGVRLNFLIDARSRHNKIANLMC